MLYRNIEIAIELCIFMNAAHVRQGTETEGSQGLDYIYLPFDQCFPFQVNMIKDDGTLLHFNNPKGKTLQKS